jgi:hypothetical protein
MDLDAVGIRCSDFYPGDSSALDAASIPSSNENKHRVVGVF